MRLKVATYSIATFKCIFNSCLRSGRLIFNKKDEVGTSFKVSTSSFY